MAVLVIITSSSFAPTRFSGGHPAELGVNLFGVLCPRKPYPRDRRGRNNRVLSVAAVKCNSALLCRYGGCGIGFAACNSYNLLYNPVKLGIFNALKKSRRYRRSSLSLRQSPQAR